MFRLKHHNHSLVTQFWLFRCIKFLLTLFTKNPFHSSYKTSICMSWLELHKGMRLLTLQRTTPSKPHVALLSKAIPKYEGPKNFPAAPFLVSFLQLAAEKNTLKTVQPEKFLVLLILWRLYHIFNTWILLFLSFFLVKLSIPKICQGSISVKYILDMNMSIKCHVCKNLWSVFLSDIVQKFLVSRIDSFDCYLFPSTVRLSLAKSSFQSYEWGFNLRCFQFWIFVECLFFLICFDMNGVSLLRNIFSSKNVYWERHNS